MKDEQYNKLVELIEGTNERIDSTNQRISEMEERFLTELEDTRRYLSYEIGQVKKMVRDESRINGRQHQAIIQLVENRYNELDDRIKVANLWKEWDIWMKNNTIN